MEENFKVVAKYTWYGGFVWQNRSNLHEIILMECKNTKKRKVTGLVPVEYEEITQMWVNNKIELNEVNKIMS